MFFLVLDAKLHEIGFLFRKADIVFEEATKILEYHELIPLEDLYARIDLFVSSQLEWNYNKNLNLPTYTITQVIRNLKKILAGFFTK